MVLHLMANMAIDHLMRPGSATKYIACIISIHPRSWLSEVDRTIISTLQMRNGRLSEIEYIPSRSHTWDQPERSGRG